MRARVVFLAFGGVGLAVVGVVGVSAWICGCRTCIFEPLISLHDTSRKIRRIVHGVARAMVLLRRISILELNTLEVRDSIAILLEGWIAGVEEG